MDDVHLADRVAKDGVYFTPLSTSYSAKRTRAGLILGIGSADKRQITDGVARLKRTLHG